MLRAFMCVLALAFSAVGDCGRAFAQERQRGPSTPAQPPAAAEVPVGDFIIAKPVQCKNLTVFPVISKTSNNEDLYTTLEEGLKSGKVDVYEVGAQPGGSVQRQPQQRNVRQRNAQQDDSSSDDYADVNHLMVRNRSAKPLYLMPGEIIYGGKQDRCVAQEYLIPVDVKPLKIDVYCVEHGRWTEGKEFLGKAGNLGKGGRAAVQEGKSQSEVWDKVGEANAASGARPATGAFTANYTDPKILEKITPYVKELERPVAERGQVVGAIVAVGGKVEVVDVFGSTPLFRKVWPKLLNGYALDAAISASRNAKKPTTPPTLKDAETFLRDAMQSGVQKKTDGKQGLVVTKRESDRVVSYSAEKRPADASRAKDKESFGKGVHSSGFSK